MSLLTPAEEELLRRAKAMHRDEYMCGQVIAWHERGAALERAAAAPVPGHLVISG